MLKLFAFALMLGAVCLRAGDWAPIPADVWAIRSGPKGALILEERMRFNLTSVEYTYRVRVFSEEGMAAADIPDLPSTALGIKGRTVYPDGRQVVFNSRKDFAERKAEAGGSEIRVKHLVAPGITSDCVMEMAWSESADGIFRGLPRRFANGLYGQWILSNPFPTRRLVVEVPKTFPLAWFLEPGSTLKPESQEISGYRVITLPDLPAVEVPPYGLKPLLRLPSLVIFFQPDSLRGVSQKDPEVYWQEASKSLYKGDYEEDVSKGSAYKALAAELLAGLPEAPAPRAAELLNRLNWRIANLSRATHAEEAALPKDFWEGFDHKDLGKAAKTGKTSGRGMRLLYYHLLKQAGFVPKIGKVVDREKAVFRWGQKNPWQFDHDLLGIDLPAGQTAWLDPTLRHAEPGVIHPDYTGLSMIEIDTSTWKVVKGVLPARDAGVNGRKFTYNLELSEDGDSFDMLGEFSGYPEYAERYAFLPLEPREQGKALRERIEKSLKNAVVSEATVLNATDPQTNVTWRVKGALEREPGRSREVDPFPGMPWPLWVPSKLDPERKTPIVPPYLSTQVAVSHFKAPLGYRPRQMEELRKENEFGRVFWVPSFDPKTGKVSVVLRVEVNAAFHEADHWEAFKTFLGWIETACRRQVVLVKEV